MSDEITERGRERCGCHMCLCPGMALEEERNQFTPGPCPIAAAYVADELAGSLHERLFERIDATLYNFDVTIHRYFQR